MLTNLLKPSTEYIPLSGENICVILCSGCDEIIHPKNDVDALISAITVSRTLTAVLNISNVCNEGNVKLYVENYGDAVKRADSILVVSCGVGVQTVAAVLRGFDDDAVAGTDVLAACDTYPLPGFQGVTPSQFDCALCCDCHLNETAGICPVTTCSKGLINGECGGAKNGICEVDPTLECGWGKINLKLKMVNGKL